jgi:predicted nucleic acid-binding protein
MIQEKIVVSDTNIFLDLISVNLLDSFFLLPCDICTTDFVINEIIQPLQIQAIDKFIKSKKLEVVSFDFSELSAINGIFTRNNNNASMTDCSVWYYAKKNNGRLLTGDGKLRKSAVADNVKVSGILYIFDNLIEYGILEKTKAADFLEQLTQINMRLPKTECENRIKLWRA